jgi:F0F1-type ATP synthase delta subunit
MHKLSRRRVAEYAAELLAKHESPMKLATYLAAYLADAKQTHQAAMLVSDIERALATHYGVVMAEATAARALSQDVRETVIKLVQEKYQAKKVILNELIDKGLIGGVTIATPEGFFDGSVRKKLQNLQAMKNKEI